MALYRAEDLGINLDRMAAPERSCDFWIYLDGQLPWNMASHALAYARIEPCPICGGKWLPARSYCLGCDRCTLDNCGVEFPGIDVGLCLDKDWSAEATILVPDRLKGGVGQAPATLAKRVKSLRRKTG
jgi:hypothetical protein